MTIKKIKGVGLLEIMIAMLLSAIVLAEIFRYSYFLESTLSFSASKVETIEENNVLFAWLVRDIEMAGYVGCVDAHARASIIDDGNYLSATWLTANGDTLESQYMSAEQYQVIEKLSDNEVLISGANHLKEEDVVFIENCWEAETAKIRKIHSVNYGAKNRIEFYASLKMSDINNAYVAKLMRHHYFIEDSGGLYVRNEKGDSDEVLENISNINISTSQNRLIISALETNSAEPIVLTASAYNAK